ncbi:MAG: hypothetical protein ACI8WT_002803 [Clostridium sp.]|jgi:hypothetical protein
MWIASLNAIKSLIFIVLPSTILFPNCAIVVEAEDEVHALLQSALHVPVHPLMQLELHPCEHDELQLEQEVQPVQVEQPFEQLEQEVQPVQVEQPFEQLEQEVQPVQVEQPFEQLEQVPVQLELHP